MAVIPLPTASRFAKHIEWTLDRPAQVNRSAWTGHVQVLATPWQGRWSAKVDLVPIIGEANVRLWRSFLARLKGQVNTFRLPATEGLQSAIAHATVAATAAAGATSLALANADAAGVAIALLDGHMVTVNDQLLQLVGDGVFNGGTGQTTITFEPPLRAAATAATAVETRAPTCLVALTGTSVGWSADPGKIYTIGSLTVEERF
jgi:hypothetical protein